MSEDVPDEDEFYQRVLDHSQKRFVSDTEPKSLLDVLLETETIDNDEYRDIDELTRTSDKNREILKTIRCKGKRGYKSLKKCLTESKQSHIVDHMKTREEEVKAIVKKERVQMPRKPGQISDQDLVFIAQSIGKNWELLGPSLGITNIEMYHLKCDYSSVQLQIKHMLNKWKDQVKDGDSSINKLVSIFRTLPEVDIDFDRIKKRFNTVSTTGRCSATEMGEMSSKVVGKPTKNTSVQQPVESELSMLNLRKEITKQVAQSSPQNTIDGKGCTNYGKDYADAISSTEELITSLNNADIQPIQETGGDIEADIGELHIKITKTEKSKEENSSKGVLNILNNNEKVVSLSQNIQVVSANTDTAYDEFRRKSEEYNKLYTSSRKCTHEGRLMVFKKDYFDLFKICCNQNMPIAGGFGTVYLCKYRATSVKSSNVTKHSFFKYSNLFVTEM